MCFCGNKMIPLLHAFLFFLCIIVTQCGIPDEEPDCPVSIYTTPALNDQFSDFRIINEIPEGGSSGSGPLQDPVMWNDTVIIFQFKGAGNALILLQKEEIDEDYPNVVMVEIGGGGTNSRVALYVSKTQGGASDQVGSINVAGVTSSTEFRSFWISMNYDNDTVSVGSGTDPTMNLHLLIPITEFNYEVTAISISTNSNNSGMWEFVSVCGASCPDDQFWDPRSESCVDDDCGPFGASPDCELRGEICRHDGACVCETDMMRCRGPNERCVRGECICRHCIRRDPDTGFCS